MRMDAILKVKYAAGKHNNINNNNEKTVLVFILLLTTFVWFNDWF